LLCNQRLCPGQDRVPLHNTLLDHEYLAMMEDYLSSVEDQCVRPELHAAGWVLVKSFFSITEHSEEAS
jgi:hypothetical protein